MLHSSGISCRSSSWCSPPLTWSCYLLCALDISRNGKLGKKKRSRELRGRWLLPAVLSVDKGDGSAQCSPAKPNTSPAGVSSNFASCPAVLGFFTLALLLVVVLVYLQQLRHFPSCRVVPRSPSKSAPCDGINYGDADAACVQNRSAVMKHVSAQKCTSMRMIRRSVWLQHRTSRS